MIPMIALGHHPHDQIDAMAVSPAYHEDRTIFVSIGKHLKKSENGGVSWKSLTRGIDNERPVTALAISVSFKNDKTTFMGTEEGSIYKSSDEGSSWSMVSSGKLKSGVSRICVSPEYDSDGIVIAISKDGGIILTRNKGRDWSELTFTTKPIGDIAIVSDMEKKTWFAGAGDGRLYISEDEGNTWKESFFFPESEGITAIAISPNFSKDGTIFLGTKKRGVIKSIDGGKTVYEKKSLLSDKYIVSIGISPNYADDKTVYASTWFESLFKSKDNGESWEIHSQGLTTDKQADSSEYRSPHFRDILVSSHFNEDRTLFLAGFDGLFESTDGGDSWQEIDTLSVGLIKGMAIAENDGEKVISIITYGAGAYFSYDGGEKWYVRNKGLTRTRLMDIVFSPSFSSDDTAFSASQGCLLKSQDGGGSWNQILLKNKLSFSDKIRAHLWDWSRRGERYLEVPDIISRWLSWKPYMRSNPYPTVIAVSPNYGQDKTIFFGTRWHGVYTSTNGGTNCDSVGRDLGRVLSISVSPNYEVDRTVFANSLGRGVFKSENGGKSWISINKGLPVQQANDTDHISVSSWETLKIIVSPSYAEDKTIFVGSSQGLFKSVSKGDQWEKVGLNTKVNGGHINGMDISPNFREDRTLLVSVYGNGLYRSSDGGTTFTEIAPQLIKSNHDLEFITFSPHYKRDNTMYAASEEHIFKSTDRGESWHMLNRPVRYENHRDVVKYKGNWTDRESEYFSAKKISFSNAPSDTASLDFVGDGISWIGTKGPDHGIARVYIDGLYQQEVDLYSDDSESMIELYTISGLSHKPHNILIEVDKKKNTQSSGTKIGIDAFDVINQMIEEQKITLYR